MGATQSSTGAQPENGTAVARTCFYEILGLEKDAADTEIKKAYRRKALELHPDRNFGDAAVATQKFAELQSAYEVLSDPHERAWYDSHRDAILSGQDATASDTEPTSFRNIRLTSTEEIMSLMRKFHNNMPFDDEPTGFFGIARDTFEHLALEEEAAAEAENLDVLDYPSFGFSDDKYDEVVKPFYSIWAGFATKKPFFWKDKYRLSDAPDRKVRRLMEKENKKLRDEAAREFNDAVRFLVTFVRKRDPRYTLNFKSQADRVESARNAAAAQAARSRAANQELLASYETPDWARSRGDDESEDHFALTEDESEVEILECVICSKSFKSEKQLQAHERSKKHLKATANLRRQMRKEGVELDLDQDIPSSRPCDLPDAAVNDELTCETLSRPSIHASEPPEEDIESHDSESQRPESSASSQLTDGGDYASRGEVLDRLALGSQETAHPIGGSGALEGETLCERTQDLVLDSELPQKKKGKARAKRERKAAASLAADTSHKCADCGMQYDSRTNLFRHIRQEGHATATPQAPKQRHGKTGRK